jgi:hypothetical protein
MSVRVRGQNYRITSISPDGTAVLENDGGAGGTIPSVHINEVIEQNKGNLELKQLYIVYKMTDGMSDDEANASFQRLTGINDDLYREMIAQGLSHEEAIQVSSVHDPVPSRPAPPAPRPGPRPPAPGSSSIPGLMPGISEEAYRELRGDGLNHEEAIGLLRLSMTASSEPAREPARPAIDPRRKIMYLACQHGVNTASTHSLYPVLSPFPSVVYYPPAAYQVLSEAKAQQLIENCRGNPTISRELQNGTFKASSRVGPRGRGYLNLPPILLKIEPGDLHKPLFINLEGVWKVEFTDNVVTSIRKIQTQRQWLATAFGDNVATIRTQSFILHKLEAIVESQGDNPAEVSVGMIACHNQDFYLDRIADMSGNSSYANAEEKSLLLPKEELFLSGIPSTGELSLAGSLVSSFDTTMAWEALAKQRVVGCGMNVLAYYGIIEQYEARCRVSALPTQGQSIFSVYTIFHDSKITVPTQFVVVRVSLTNSDAILQQLQTLPENVVTFVKLYAADTMQKAGVTVDSHVGHTISFIKHRGVVYLVDPQAGVTVPIYSGAELRQHTRYTDKEFMDMVFIARPAIDRTGRTIYSVDAFRGLVAHLRGRILSMNGLHWGGKRKKHKTKRTKQKIRKTRR